MQDIEDLYELSPMQQGMLFHTLYTPDSEIYFEQLLCTFCGKLIFSAFTQAWEQVIARHPVLRSSFYWEEIEKPLQMVSRKVKLPWVRLDWRNLTPDEQKKHLEDFLSSDRQQPFQLNVAPLMRFTIIQLGEETYQFIWSHHHILFDGWSMQIVLKEVLAFYEANQRGEDLRFPPTRPYGQYIQWLQGQDIEGAKKFWQKTLQGFAAPTSLGGNRDKGTYKGKEKYNEQHFQLSEMVTEKLQLAARSHHLTLNNLVQGAWGLLISRYSGERDVVFGGTVSGRLPTLEGVDSMVGLLINTLPIRVDVTGNQELLKWLQDLQIQGLEREQYGYCSLAEIQQMSNIPSGLSLFESILVFENYPLSSAQDSTKKTLEVSDISCFERTNYPLTVVINPRSQLSGRIIYDASCFAKETIARMIGHFQTLLVEMAASLESSYLESSYLQNSYSDNSNSENSNSENSNLQNSDLQNSNLQNFNLENSSLQNSNLQNFNLENSDLENSNSQNFNLENSSLEGFKLENSNLETSNLKKYISQLSLLSAEEESQLVLLENQQLENQQQTNSIRCNFTNYTQDSNTQDSNLTNYNPINYKCIHTLFEEQVEKNPDAIALVYDKQLYEKQHLTYRELNNRANQLAHYLQSLGVKPEVRVGICIERSLEMVVGILAILKAGGVYVPLDPAYPSERLALMIEDVQAPILLTQTHLQDRLPQDNQIVVNLDSDWEVFAEVIAKYPEENLLTQVAPENLAYIIYTSGSTGTPKGTEVPHRSILGFMFGVDYIHLDAKQIWLQHSSISWDALTLELWTPLLYGGICVLYPEKIPTPLSLSEIIQEQKINTLFLTTALFNLMIDTMPQGLSGVKQLLTGGESVSVPHLHHALKLLPETQIINGYGPSECTVFTCCYPIPPQLPENIHSIPIGKPIGDRTVYILDEDLHRVPIGVPGELYVGGASVARGYLNQSKLTREKFIPNPFIEGDTLYKTGDLVRRLVDGNLEFISRIDTQVKIRGFRIESAEIEAVLIQHPDIKQVVVIVREDEPGNKYLVAYLLSQDISQDNQPSPGVLRTFLKEKLPDYMIPAVFVFLSAFPLTPNGKINRRGLPAPDTSQRHLEIDFVAPSTSTEQELAAIWTEVLKLKQVGVHDNFFELGGHSLLATQVISRLREAFSVDFSVGYLFENPTIAQLAQKVTEEQFKQVENDALAEILGEVDGLSELEVKEQLL